MKNETLQSFKTKAQTNDMYKTNYSNNRDFNQFHDSNQFSQKAKDTNTIFLKNQEQRRRYKGNDFYLNDLAKNSMDYNFYPDINMMDHLNTKSYFQHKSRAILQHSKSKLISQEQINNNINEKFLENAPQSIRNFYQHKKNYVNILNDYDQLKYCLEEVQQKVQCYRYELGNVLRQIGEQFKSVIERIMEQHIKMMNKIQNRQDEESKHQLQLICRLEKEKKDQDEYIKKLKNLQSVQETEYNICKLDNEARKKEILLLHDLLQKNRIQQIDHLSNLQDLHDKQRYDPSEDMMKNVSSLNTMLVQMENENLSRDDLVQTMEALLKAMLTSKKKNACTQLDEIELQASYQKNFSYREVIQQEKNDIELLKQNNNEEEIDKISKINGENWNFPPSLIVFMENSLKKKDNSRVLPYQYFKNIIYDIYRMRIQHQGAIQSNMFHQFIEMDEFICIYFLETFKLRRLAEIKMLEFMVSLKYYSKIWPRAAIFSYLIHVCKYQNYNQRDTSFEYNFDIYVQQYFLYMFGIFEKEKKWMMENQDGNLLVDKKRIDDISKEILFFSVDSQKKKLTAKMMRLIKTIEIKPKHEFEGVDADKMMEYALEEFLIFRKENFKLISKKFQKVYDTVHGIFSIDDIAEIFGQFTDRKSTIENYKYPGYFQIMRVYLHSLTSGGNKYNINSKDFLRSMQKYGMDSPFPFCYEGYLKTETKSETQNIQNQMAGVISQNIQNQSRITSSQKNRGNLSSREQEDNNEDQKNISQGFSNVSEIMSKHFSILRELNQYVHQFRQSINSEQDQEIIWRHFDNIVQVLQNGCNFLSFPLKEKL